MKSTSIFSKITLFARVLLGLIMVIFGINGFYTFIPIPEFHPFMQLLVDSGYMNLIKAIEIAGGFCLLFPRTTNLGLLLITPIIVNIVAYHFFFDPRNWFMSVFIALLLLIVLFSRFTDFWHLITATNKGRLN